MSYDLFSDPDTLDRRGHATRSQQFYPETSLDTDLFIPRGGLGLMDQFLVDSCPHSPVAHVLHPNDLERALCEPDPFLPLPPPRSPQLSAYRTSRFAEPIPSFEDLPSPSITNAPLYLSEGNTPLLWLAPEGPMHDDEPAQHIAQQQPNQDRPFRHSWPLQQQQSAQVHAHYIDLAYTHHFIPIALNNAIPAPPTSTHYQSIPESNITAEPFNTTLYTNPHLPNPHPPSTASTASTANTANTNTGNTNTTTNTSTYHPLSTITPADIIRNRTKSWGGWATPPPSSTPPVSAFDFDDSDDEEEEEVISDYGSEGLEGGVEED
jgi:hypothetical protein